MANTLTWVIESLKTSSNSDTSEAHWRVNGVSSETHSVQTPGMLEPIDSPYYGTVYGMQLISIVVTEETTEADVIAAVKESIPTKLIEQIEAEVNRQIEEQKSPTETSYRFTTGAARVA